MFFLNKTEAKILNMSSKRVPSELISILEEACGGKLDNFDVTVHVDNANGLGYLGEMVWKS